MTEFELSYKPSRTIWEIIEDEKEKAFRKGFKLGWEAVQGESYYTESIIDQAWKEFKNGKS